MPSLLAAAIERIVVLQKPADLTRWASKDGAA